LVFLHKFLINVYVNKEYASPEVVVAGWWRPLNVLTIDTSQLAKLRFIERRARIIVIEKESVGSCRR
jgi:hypothetical protein